MRALRCDCDHGWWRVFVRMPARKKPKAADADDLEADDLEDFKVIGRRLEMVPMVLLDAGEAKKEDLPTFKYQRYFNGRDEPALMEKWGLSADHCYGWELAKNVAPSEEYKNYWDSQAGGWEGQNTLAIRPYDGKGADWMPDILSYPEPTFVPDEVQTPEPVEKKRRQSKSENSKPTKKSKGLTSAPASPSSSSSSASPSSSSASPPSASSLSVSPTSSSPPSSKKKKGVSRSSISLRACTCRNHTKHIRT
jgi:hypothetical protein